MGKHTLAVWPGKPYPLGATWDGEGVNFALFSEHAERVELCLFDLNGRRELERIPMRWQTDQVWHCYLPETRPGQLYGYRVHGPYAPDQGLRFNSKQKRNFLATLLLSQGVPMLWAGDEMGRTQQGNNNAYCQDNEISWMDWCPSSDDQELLSFVRQLTRLRKRHAAFRRRYFFQEHDERGRPVHDDNLLLLLNAHHEKSPHPSTARDAPPT